MLRNIHKASSTWLGKVVMGVVVGVLVISFAIWGIGDIFRGFGENEVAKVGGAEISIEQFRQYYNDQLQQLGRQRGRADHAPSRRAPPVSTARSSAQLIAETALDERRRTAARPHRRRDRPAHHRAIRISAGPPASSTAPSSRASSTRPASPKPASSPSSAACCCAGRSRRASPATCACRRPRWRRSTSSATRSAASTISRSARPRPAPSRRRRTEQLDQVFRRPQGAVPRAGISQDRHPVGDAGRSGQAGRSVGRRRQGLLRRSTRPVRPAREARGAPDRLSEEAEAAAAAREKIAKGESFERHRQGARLEAADTDLGMVTEADDHRSGRGQGRLRAQERRGEPADQGPIRHRAGDGRQDRAGRGEDLRAGRAADQARDRAAARARTKLGDLRDKIEDEKAAGATLAEAAKKLEPEGARDRRGRPRRQRARRQAGARSAEAIRT